MKFFNLFTVCALTLLSLPVFADATNENLLKELNRLNRKVDRVLDAVEKPIGPDVSIVRAGVNTKCLKTNIDAYPSAKTLSVLEVLTNNCRDTFDDRACKKIGDGTSQGCFDMLVEAYPSSKTLSVLEAIRGYCAETIYKCE